MSKTMKGKRSKEMIIESACVLLAEENYDSLSLNQFCMHNNISKGQFYHHFSSKDALYLETIKYVYDLFYTTLKNSITLGNGFEIDLKNYLSIRKNFSLNYPIYSSVFFKSLLSPPDNLKNEINRLHQDIKQFNYEVLSNIVKSAPLRDGLNHEQVVTYYILVIDTFNQNFSFNNSSSLESYLNLFDVLVDTLLYGTIERGY